MEKVDRRVQRTQKLLGDFLIELAREQGYGSVTIKDITERANVAYVTFFRHYHDKQELLMEILDGVIGEIEGMARTMNSASHHETEGRLIFEHAAANRDFYLILLQHEGTASLYRRVRDELAILTRGYLQHHCQGEDAILIPLDIAANHVAASLLSLLEWWLQHDMPYPPERMAAIYAQLIIAPSLPAGQSSVGRA